MRRDQIKVRIAEQEEINRRMKEKLERKNTELRQGEFEEDQEIKKMDAKLLENEKSTIRLSKLKEEQIEYSALVGSLLSKALKVDYKGVPGNCLCPGNYAHNMDILYPVIFLALKLTLNDCLFSEKKVCASSTGAEIECDFWTCPLINPSVDQAETTMATLSKTITH